MNDLQHMKILLINDDSDSIDVTVHMLKKGGFRNIQSVSSAQEGLAVLETITPDLVLLDIVMPDMDGLEFCKTVKAAPETKNIPVIMLSGSFRNSDQALQQAFEAGAIDFIPKPLRKPELLARVQSALSLKQARDSIRQELSKSTVLAERLQTALEFVHSIIETSLFAIVVTDTKGCITRVNDACLQMLGYTRNEVVGRFMVELAPRESGVYETAIGEKIEIEEAFFNRARTMIETLFEQGKVARFEGFIRRKDEKIVLTDENNVLIYNEQKEVVAAASIILDITERKQIETEREKLIAELKEALTHVKTLRGMLPICASCKKIRDDKGYWSQIEEYIADHSEAEFSHSICPECSKKLYPELYGNK